MARFGWRDLALGQLTLVDILGRSLEILNV
jgi:hypothetical protein